MKINDWNRFTGKTIGSFVGLAPSECSSGQSRIQGGITKPGNSHVRRLLVEAGNARLYRQWIAFTARKKRPVVANTPIARELAGWCWSLAVMDD